MLTRTPRPRLILSWMILSWTRIPLPIVVQGRLQRIRASFALSVAVALMLLATAARATVTLVQQTRSVSTFATVDFRSGEDAFSQDLFQSQDPGQFQEVADCQAGVPGDQATAVANQLSYVEPQSLLAEGNFQAEAEIGEMATFAEGFGEARYSPTFSVDEPTQIRLRATLNATGNGRVNLIFRIRDGEILVYRTLFDGSDSIDETRVLAPGTYDLEAQTSGFGQALPERRGSGLRQLRTVIAVCGSVGRGARSARGASFPPLPWSRRIRFAAKPASSGPGAPRPAGGDRRDAVMVLDPSGRVVRRFEEVGPSGVVWDTRDDAGRPVAAGMYLIRRTGGASTRAVRVIR